MNITEILQMVDQLVCTETGQHLDNIQEAVVKGVWQGQTYEEIAKECNRSESRARNVAHRLWKLLSEHLGEEISKANFRSTLERLNITSPSIVIQNNRLNRNHSHNSNNFNVCPFLQTKDNIEEIRSFKSEVRNYYDLTLAPKVTHFYGRDRELKKLTESIINQQTRLISVLGLDGIGKTTLVKRFIDLNAKSFDIIIWKSLKFPKSLDSLLENLLETIGDESPENTDDKLIKIFDILAKRRCLIILDDVQELFIKGKFAGQYKNEYKDYKILLTLITEIEHQSSLILISQEQCQEMICLDRELSPAQCLQLEGLDNSEILKNQGLKYEESWSKLIDLYEGNPVYLKNIANLIKNIFLGKVSNFLKEDSLFLTEEIKSNLTELFSRLSPIEQQIILKISQSNQSLSRKNLKQSLEISPSDLINGLQSLSKRYLVKIREEDIITFDISPVLRAYLLSK